MYIYVIAPESTGHPVKIGVSAKVPARLPGLQTGNPDRLQVFHKEIASASGHMATALRLEGLVHAKLAAAQLTGEWFSVPVSVAVAKIGEVRLEAGLMDGTLTISEKMLLAAQVADQTRKINKALQNHTGLNCLDRPYFLPKLIGEFGYGSVCAVFAQALAENRYRRRTAAGLMLRSLWRQLLRDVESRLVRGGRAR